MSRYLLVLARKMMTAWIGKTIKAFKVREAYVRRAYGTTKNPCKYPAAFFSMMIKS